MIPIENIYYMLSYAWGHVQEADTIDRSGIACETPQDLFGLVLSRAVMQLLRKGLDRDYLPHQEDLRGVRGRIAIDETAKRALKPKGEISCVFDELTHDILQNRIVYSTLTALSRTEALSAEVRAEVNLAVSRFPRVTSINPLPRDFHSIQIHRNNRFYKFVLDICQIILQNLLVESSTPGLYRFHDFRRDQARMGKLFEDFVRNFLEQELSDTWVSAPKVPWAVEANERSLNYLPAMQTDITLRRNREQLIIDTKFYAKPLTLYRGRERIFSHNLYQILSYVTNASVITSGIDETQGMLLYGSVDRDLSMDYKILGYPIRIRSVNLNQPWRDVHDVLLAKVEACLGESERRSRPLERERV